MRLCSHCVLLTSTAGKLWRSKVFGLRRKSSRVIQRQNAATFRGNCIARRSVFASHRPPGKLFCAAQFCWPCTDCCYSFSSIALNRHARVGVFPSTPTPFFVFHGSQTTKCSDKPRPVDPSVKAVQLCGNSFASFVLSNLAHDVSSGHISLRPVCQLLCQSCATLCRALPLCSVSVDSTIGRDYPKTTAFRRLINARP